jgi:hypothetical protein
LGRRTLLDQPNLVASTSHDPVFFQTCEERIQFCLADPEDMAEEIR